MTYSNEKTTTVASGIGFLDALFLVFLVLKLTKVIDWSWWWITAPLWGQVALCAVIIVVAITILAVIKVIDIISDRNIWGKE